MSLREIGRIQTIEITGSLDGAMISKNRRHLTGELKISDRCARCPFSKELILSDPNDLKAQPASESVLSPKSMYGTREPRELEGVCSNVSIS